MNRFAALGAWMVLSLGALGGCKAFNDKMLGASVGKVELKGPGTATAKFQAPGSKLRLYSDYDASWRGIRGANSRSRGTPSLEYDVIVKQGATTLAKLEGCRLAGGGIGGSTLQTGETVNGDAEQPISCDLPAISAGEVEITVTGRTGDNVLGIKKMNINVRVDK